MTKVVFVSSFWNLLPILAQAMMYADDIVLIAMDKWREALNKRKIISIVRENTGPMILCKGEPLELTNTWHTRTLA